MNWVSVDTEVVVVDSTSGDTHILSGAAAIVWPLLGDVTVADLEAHAIATYGIDREHASHDVATALGDMLDRKLVIASPAA